MNAYIEFADLAKVYPTVDGPVAVVKGFDLQIEQGEFVSIIGHSGCGKSTVLSMIAGLNEISDGAIYIDGRRVVGPGPDRGVVFQSPSLFPWMTAMENVLLGVEQVFPHGSKRERREIAEYYLNRVGLVDALDKRAAELSQGMRQLGHCPRLCPQAQAAAARRAVWDARFADPHRAARRAVGGLAARPDYRNHGDPRCG